jgi:hypothetical protein
MLSLTFLNKNVISPKFAIFNICKCTFGVDMFCIYTGTFPARESGKQVLAGLAPSSQTIESLLIIPFPTKPEGKNWQKVI